eukprot:12023220-Heterocapsa_arctica.AAC.1
MQGVVWLANLCRRILVSGRIASTRAPKGTTSPENSWPDLRQYGVTSQPGFPRMLCAEHQ